MCVDFVQSKLGIFNLKRSQYNYVFCDHCSTCVAVIAIIIICLQKLTSIVYKY